MDAKNIAVVREVLCSDKFNDICFGDGHTIYDPEMYIRAGIPKEVVAPLVRSFKPDGSLKGIDRCCTGVSNLDFLGMLAGVVNADTSIADTKFGRGSEARELVAAIKKAI